MTPREFEHGYWYRVQLKESAERIGIPGATKLRKDELEKAIVLFLRTGKAALPTNQGCRMAPTLRRKSGVWYRLNRWREEQITSGSRPTYGDLVRQYVALNRTPRFERIPIRCYNYFVADFLAADNNASRAQIVAAWNKLKKLDAPKDYASWVKAQAKRKGKRRPTVSHAPSRSRTRRPCCRTSRCAPGRCRPIMPVGGQAT